VNTGERNRLWTGLAFISPWLVGFAVFTAYPLTAALYYSFCDYDVLSRPIWVGLLNYRDMATDDVFWQSLNNTLVFSAVSLPLGLTCALALALLLNRPVAARSVYRAIYYLPSLVPAVAAAAVWLWILNARNGLLNQALRSIGVSHPPQWLDDFYLWADAGNYLHIFEFDGQNSHDITSVTPGFTAALSQDDKVLFSISTNAALQSSSLAKN